jgi:hypothetical protein
VQDPITHKLIPKEEYRRREAQGLYIMGDLEPYIAVGGKDYGKVISGRRAHREYLRRNNLIEVGNEKEPFVKYGGKSEDNPTKNWMKEYLNERGK